MQNVNFLTIRHRNTMCRRRYHGAVPRMAEPVQPHWATGVIVFGWPVKNNESEKPKPCCKGKVCKLHGMYTRLDKIAGYISIMQRAVQTIVIAEAF